MNITGSRRKMLRLRSLERVFSVFPERNFYQRQSSEFLAHCKFHVLNHLQKCYSVKNGDFN